ncbi:response regulator transcription factor [Sphingobacterium corticibacter]|uniref:DNA-binding response regulator n=1 Tax=Sphingobacterium corticibacter TaxID=2171749 RepID=A0A2T8HLX7_9SPHI|nr:response regulator transcription factor [Sphingobacterium corticibacter]PVH26441.1 DNA-binding response regulator [Sphingobacterium corticibacter]
MQILLVEDDNRISSFLIKGLEEVGYSVTLSKNAEEVLDHYIEMSWDLMIVDVMLPKMDGIQLVQSLRYKKNLVPVLMLSALQTVNDKVSALDSGADDYMTKPFHFAELLSRIHALTRRHGQQLAPRSNIIEIADLQIDLHQYQVSRNGVAIELSPREFKLFKYLVDHKNMALSRLQILNAVWNIHFDNQTNVVDVYISYLRNKLETADLKYIYTVKGIGYMFKSSNL